MKNKENAKYNYFISFLHTSRNTYGYGDTTIGINTKIETDKEIDEIRQTIIKNKTYENVVILNIQRLPI